jgi:hypothetical protein
MSASIVLNDVGEIEDTMASERLGHLSNVAKSYKNDTSMNDTYGLTNVVANIRHVLQEAEDCERYVVICWVEFVSARGFGCLRRRFAATSGPFGGFIDLQVLEKVAKTRDTPVRNINAIVRVL